MKKMLKNQKIVKMLKNWIFDKNEKKSFMCIFDAKYQMQQLKF